MVRAYEKLSAPGWCSAATTTYSCTQTASLLDNRRYQAKRTTDSSVPEIALTAAILSLREANVQGWVLKSVVAYVHTEKKVRALVDSTIKKMPKAVQRGLNNETLTIEDVLIHLPAGFRRPRASLSTS